MIDEELKPYPEYKASRVPWLPHLPMQWQVLRGKNIFRVIDVRSETGKEELLTVSSSDGVVPRSQKTVTMFQAESYVGHKLCWPDDLVINSLWAWMQGLGFSKHHGIVSSAYSVYRMRPTYNEYGRYFDYLLRSAAYKWELLTRSKGVWISRLQLLDSAFLDMPILIPSRDEVATIVRYLDHVDRRVRRYIRAKQKLIALLNEQKQVIIQQAVTGGLDPNAPRKPSGVEWLGDVPAHWEIMPLKKLATIQSGVTLGKRYLDHKLVEYPYLRVANVQDGHLNLSTVKTLLLSEDDAARSMLQNGDVLMTEGGDPDKLGRGCVWDGQISPCLHQNHIFAVRTERTRLHPNFLVALLSSYYAKIYFLLTAKQTTNLASTNKTTIGQLPILLPSVKEQTQLLSILALETQQVQQAMATARHEIDLIREYRTRLIADIVTGKLDVRAVAAQLPIEEDEPTAFVADETPENAEEIDDNELEPESVE